MKRYPYESIEAPQRRGSLPYSLRGDLGDTADTLVKIRMLEAMDRGAARYPIYRKLRYAVRRQLEPMLDDFALRSGMLAQRMSESTLLVSLAGELLPQEGLFTIDWHFTTAHTGLTSVAFEELADEPLLDAAYPSLQEPSTAFIDRYLKLPETVLILQGPPGTGKTRLVRAILAALSRTRSESAKILYASDRRTLDSDELFVEFITGSHHAFVVEDADHLLQARANGNVDLHRFLAIADGVIRAQGRKIIFTTNLPNISDVDDALLRPGRCFAAVKFRALDRGEAVSLLRALLDRRGATMGPEDLLPGDRRSFTVADIHRLAQE